MLHKFGKPYFYDVTNSSLQSTGPRVDDNEWHHIIGVLDGTSKKIYIDGELIASATVTGIKSVFRKYNKCRTLRSRKQ